MKKILLATDGSSCSLEAGRKTLEFLAAWPQAELIVLHVIPPMSYSFDTTVILPEIEASEKAEIEEGRQTFEAQFGD
ncbi:MAG: universal stress protein [Alicyclobacillus sp.]|nr:universal stress protein [Alicyclobacillus sp.]